VLGATAGAILLTCRYAGDAEGRGGIYNFVTKRGLCAGEGSKISWTQVGILAEHPVCFDVSF
jgi:hypothetical protein